MRSQAASSWSVPITLTSWRIRAGLSGSGYQRIPQWTTVSAPVPGSSRESSGPRMSASIKSVRSSSTGGGTVSIPARYSIDGSRSSLRASSAPQWLATPVITTRRPGRHSNPQL